MENLIASAKFGLRFSLACLLLAIIAMAFASTSLPIFLLIPMAILTLPTIIFVHLGLTFGIYSVMQLFGYYFPGENGASFFLLMFAPSIIISAQIQGMLYWYITRRKRADNP